MLPTPPGFVPGAVPGAREVLVVVQEVLVELRVAGGPVERRGGPQAIRVVVADAIRTGNPADTAGVGDQVVPAATSRCQQGVGVGRIKLLEGD